MSDSLRTIGNLIIKFYIFKEGHFVAYKNNRVTHFLLEWSSGYNKYFVVM